MRYFILGRLPAGNSKLPAEILEGYFEGSLSIEDQPGLR